MIERITNLDAAPVVGRYYLVPMIRWEVINHVSDWPIFLPLHNDARFFAVATDHFHLDPRFIGGHKWRLLATHYFSAGPLETAQATVVGRNNWGAYAKDAKVSNIQWKRQQCIRAQIEYMHGNKKAVQNMRGHYAGHQCAKARSGWICPHQNWPMGSVEPDKNGVMSCPLHGLQIDAETGLVLPHRSGASA